MNLKHLALRCWVGVAVAFTLHASGADFDGIWQGGIESDDEGLEVRLTIKGGEIVQEFRNESGWKRVMPAKASVTTLGDSLVFTWIRQGGIWTEQQTFSLTRLNSNTVNVVRTRHVINRDNGEDGEAWSVTAKGDLRLMSPRDLQSADLLAAVDAGSLSNVQHHVSAGADVNVRDPAGFTPLMHAVLLKDRTAIAEFLIGKGASIEAKDADGDTPLLLACYKGNVEAVKLLIRSKANVNARNAENESALDRVKIGVKEHRGFMSMLGGDFAEESYQNNPKLDPPFDEIAAILKKAGAQP